jgi:hypothetical protein
VAATRDTIEEGCGSDRRDEFETGVRQRRAKRMKCEGESDRLDDGEGGGWQREAR